MKQRQWRPQLTHPEAIRGWVFFAIYVGLWAFSSGCSSGRGRSPWPR